MYTETLFIRLLIHHTICMLHHHPGRLTLFRYVILSNE